MAEKKLGKQRRLLVSLKFESNRFEEESMAFAYELVQPFQKKSTESSYKRMIRQREQIKEEQLHIAL